MRFTRDFYIPKTPTRVFTRSELNAIVYFVEVHGKLCALGFSGKRHKPDFNYSFKTEDHRIEYVAKYFLGLKANMARKNDYKESRKANAKSFLNSLKPGAILYASWGYEQTNIDFYKVLEVKGSKVLLVDCPCVSQEATGWASDKVVAGEPSPEAVPFWKNVRGSHIKISSCQSLSIYDGHPLHRSWYA